MLFFCMNEFSIFFFKDPKKIVMLIWSFCCTSNKIYLVKALGTRVI